MPYPQIPRWVHVPPKQIFACSSLNPKLAQSFARVRVLHHSQITHTPQIDLVACLAIQTTSHPWYTGLFISTQASSLSSLKAAKVLG